MINTKHGSCVGLRQVLLDCFDFEKDIRKKTKNAEKISSFSCLNYTNTACSLHYYCLHFLAKMQIAKQESNPDLLCCQSIWIRVLQRYWRKRKRGTLLYSSKKLKVDKMLNSCESQKNCEISSAISSKHRVTMSVFATIC